MRILYKAIVVNNVDPQGRGRIQVQILNEQNPIWAEAITHIGGSNSIDGSGFIFPPIPGTQVWIIYDGTTPLWIGSSFYNEYGEANPPTRYKINPRGGYIQSYGGHGVAFDDDENSPTHGVELFTSFGSRLQLFRDEIGFVSDNAEIIINQGFVRLQSQRFKISLHDNLDTLFIGSDNSYITFNRYNANIDTKLFNVSANNINISTSTYNIDTSQYNISSSSAKINVMSGFNISAMNLNISTINHKHVNVNTIDVFSGKEISINSAISLSIGVSPKYGYDNIIFSPLMLSRLLLTPSDVILYSTTGGAIWLTTPKPMPGSIPINTAPTGVPTPGTTAGTLQPAVLGGNLYTMMTSLINGLIQLLTVMQSQTANFTITPVGPGILAAPVVAAVATYTAQLGQILAQHLNPAPTPTNILSSTVFHS